MDDDGSYLRKRIEELADQLEAYREQKAALLKENEELKEKVKRLSELLQLIDE